MKVEGSRIHVHRCVRESVLIQRRGPGFDSARHSTTCFFRYATRHTDGFGRVFKGALLGPSGYGRGLVIKLALPGCEHGLENEAKAYTQLGKLTGQLTPKFYGLFSGVFEGLLFSIIVLSYEGHSLMNFDGLAKFMRYVSH